MKVEACKGKNRSIRGLKSTTNDLKILTISVEQDVLRMGGRDHALTGHSTNEIKQVSITCGIELAGDVIQHQNRRFPQHGFEMPELGNLEREHERAQLTLRAMQARRALPEHHLQVVHVRPGGRKAAGAVATKQI